MEHKARTRSDLSKDQPQTAAAWNSHQVEVESTMNHSKTKRIVIAQEFSRYPAGRFPEDGQFNGTTFREEHLVPALRNFDKVEVIFDGVAGFGFSFLEEAFGALIRNEGMDKSFLDTKLVISTTEPDLEDDIQLTKRCINAAAGASL